MSKLDPYELEVLEAYESGNLKPIAGKAELQRLRAAARATGIKDKRAERNGVPLLPSRRGAAPVSPELVNQLRDELP